jgi:hypothetical protein
MIECAGLEFANPLADEMQGLPALSNKKQDNFDQMHADSIIKPLGIAFLPLERFKKNIFCLKEKQMKNSKPCRDPYLGKDLSMNVINFIIYYVTHFL